MASSSIILLALLAILLVTGIVICNRPTRLRCAVANAFAQEPTSTESRIGFARQTRNECVLVFNDAAMQVPANLVARLFGLGQTAALQSTHSAAERSAPPVRF